MQWLSRACLKKLRVNKAVRQVLPYFCLCTRKEKQRLRVVNSLCVVLHAVLERDADERRHVDAFPHGEVPVGFQRPDEQQQERLVEQQVVEQLQTAVKPIPPRQVNLLNVKQERERGRG